MTYFVFYLNMRRKFIYKNLKNDNFNDPKFN